MDVLDYDENRVSFAAQDMIIDEHGVSGNFITTVPILSFDKGSWGGWAFSVDQSVLRLMANDLNAGCFSSAIGLPVSDDSKLKYSGTFTTENEYALTFPSLDTLPFNVFGAKVQIDKGSYVKKMHIANEKFKPEALLQGRMGVNEKLK